MDDNAPLLATTRELARLYIENAYRSVKDKPAAQLNELAVTYQGKRVQMEFEKYMGAQTTIVSKITDANEKDAALGDMLEVDRMCSELFTKYAEVEKRSQRSLLDQTIGANQHSRKAPESLADFDGLHDKWPAFHDLFKALVIDNEYSDLERFLLLKKHCKGSAAEIVAGYPPVEASFELAWTSLKDIFEDKYSITQALIDKIIGLKPAADRSVAEMRRVIDTFRSTIRQLRSMGVNVDAWDAIVINLITRKVPSATVHEWEQQRDRKEVQKLDELMIFLDGKARLRLFATEYQGGRNNNRRDQQASTSHNVNTVATSDSKKPLFITKGAPRTCNKCKGDHLIYYCPEFLNITDAKQREAEAVKLGLCLNCLRTGHEVAKCQAEGCRACQDAKHNRLLCPKPSTQKRVGAKINHTSNKKAKKAAAVEKPAE